MNLRRIASKIIAFLKRWRIWLQDSRCSRRARSRDRQIADAYLIAREANATLRVEREQFRNDLAERDSRIELLELENKGLVAINTRYGQWVERDLAIFSRQIEEAKAPRPSHIM